MQLSATLPPHEATKRLFDCCQCPVEVFSSRQELDTHTEAVHGGSKSEVAANKLMSVEECAVCKRVMVASREVMEKHMAEEHGTSYITYTKLFKS